MIGTIANLNLWHNFIHSYTFKILHEAWILFLQLWPYIVIGILITALVRIYLSKGSISHILLKNSVLSIVFAALIGVVSPLGSYVIIPLSVSLLSVGVPLSVVMALVVSSPIINPNLFILTAGALGYEVAIARVVSAFVLGLTAGYITHLLANSKRIPAMALANVNEAFQINIQMKINTDDKPGSFQEFIKIFWKETVKMTLWISRFFLIAIVIAAAIKIITPPNLILKLFGKSEFISILISTAAGVPFYSCGGAAIPIVQELSDMGMSNGAVLAFFISGPVTKISNLVVLKSAYNNVILTIYLATGIVGAIILGLLYNFLLNI